MKELNFEQMAAVNGGDRAAICEGMRVTYTGMAFVALFTGAGLAAAAGLCVLTEALC